MTVLIKEIREKSIWEQFVLSDENGSFLQSWNWGEFQQTMGEKVFRLGIFEKEKLTGVSLLIKIHAKRSDHLICPAGPLINWGKTNYFKALIEYFKKLGQKESVSFIRIRPPVEQTRKNRRFFKDLGFIPAAMHLHAERTWLLDIIPEEDILLSNMRKTTRYLIRKAEREGVEVFQSQEMKNVDHLYRLQKEAVSRHRFTPFSQKHFENIASIFFQEDQASLFLAKYKGEIISAAMIMFYGRQAVYHYAATSSKYPKIPSSCLLVWKAILESKKRNFKTFNFWGIAPPNRLDHRFAGVTLFKKGFGGYGKVFLHAHDLPLSSSYLINLLVEKVRKKVRRL